MYEMVTMLNIVLDVSQVSIRAWKKIVDTTVTFLMLALKTLIINSGPLIFFF